MIVRVAAGPGISSRNTLRKWCGSCSNTCTLHCQVISRIAGAVVALTLTALTPNTSWAARPESNPAVIGPPNRWQEPVALEGHLGTGTPLGLAGVALDVTPVPWLSLNAGVGAGGSGAQFAGMARLRLAPAPVTGGIGAGVSAGRYAWDNQCKVYYGPCSAMLRMPDIYRVWNPAIWGNAEFFLEGRTAGRFQWRVYIGLGRILNAGSSSCTWQSIDGQRPAGCDGTPFLGYFGTALGFTL